MLCMHVCVCVCVYDFIIRKPLFFLRGGWADVHAPDKEAHCEEATAWLDTIQRVHQWETLRGVYVI